MGQSTGDRMRLEATDKMMNHHLARKIEEDEKKRKSIEEDRPTGHEADMEMTYEIDIWMTNDGDQN